MLKDFFWKFVLARLARAQGFLDPVKVFSNYQRFSKPSEVWAPTELLRSGAIFQARGLMNSQAIQHNLDWVWPYWVECQFNPRSDAFIPRAFSLTHINMTHRNWTAVGLPDVKELPIVDPRGLVTPFFDGWSVDAWILKKSGKHHLPSRFVEATQELALQPGLRITTRTASKNSVLETQAWVEQSAGSVECRMTYSAETKEDGAWLAVALRPYNPEGVSFIDRVRLLSEKKGWNVNGAHDVFLNEAPARFVFSNYAGGDVLGSLEEKTGEGVRCDTGMATAAALYPLSSGRKNTVSVRVPISGAAPVRAWEEHLRGRCLLKIPDSRFQFLFDAALHMLVLHSPGDVYPGPYTYKRFWFRDAAFILYALGTCGWLDRVEHVIDRFSEKQTPGGYFLSQEGEWDSNGEALWSAMKYVKLAGVKPKPAWRQMVLRGARWISKKRVPKNDSLHSGLLPVGFSAEHLGPNDYYYWDDFWSVAGLNAAAFLAEGFSEKKEAEKFRAEARDLMDCTERSLEKYAERVGHSIMPASPYRRLDSGIIGSVAAGYPLQLWPGNDERLLETAGYLFDNCFVKGGFYQEMSHSGINVYLTLHVAQLLLRAGDPKFFELMNSVAAMASPTGQWPEAIHPRTQGGCMGDGQHIWAAAEWVLMIRNMFVREEEAAGSLVLGSGVPQAWTSGDSELQLGPVWTDYGRVTVRVRTGETPEVFWEADWHANEPRILIDFPGYERAQAVAGQTSHLLKKRGNA